MSFRHRDLLAPGTAGAVTAPAEFPKVQSCDCDLAGIVVAMRWTVERKTPRQARDRKVTELAHHLGWQSLRGRGGRRALLERFVTVETGPPPKPGDVVLLNVLHMTAAWYRHVRHFASVGTWMAHAVNQPTDLRDRPPETRRRITSAAEWIVVHPDALPYRPGGRIHRANVREVLARLWGFTSGESLRRALGADRQHRTVATVVNFRGLFAALHGRPAHPQRWTDDDRAAFNGWARWTFPGLTDFQSV